MHLLRVYICSRRNSVGSRHTIHGDSVRVDRLNELSNVDGGEAGDVDGEMDGGEAGQIVDRHLQRPPVEEPDHPHLLHHRHEFGGRDDGAVLYPMPRAERCRTVDQQWGYIKIGRLAILVKAAINRGLHWAEFEPSDEAMSAKVRRKRRQIFCSASNQVTLSKELSSSKLYSSVVIPRP